MPRKAIVVRRVDGRRSAAVDRFGIGPGHCLESDELSVREELDLGRNVDLSKIHEAKAGGFTTYHIRK